jgi:nucleoid DNA-binding protein
MKHNKITEMEIEEIKKELQANQRSHLEGREEEELEHLGTIRDREQKPNTAFTTEEETEILQQRDQTYKIKKKLKVRIIR